MTAVDLDAPLSRRAIELAQGLLRVPSVNPPGDVSACADVLAGAFREAEIPVELVEGEPGRVNVVARLTGGRGGRRVMLNGHLDVVPATAGWQVDPFEGRIDGGRLIGRGAVDMKSGVAAMAAVMEELRRRGEPRRGEVLFTAVADEETGSHHGTQLLLRRGFRADMAIVGEPTNLEISHGNRGSWWATVTITGKAAHAARPHLGVNALAAAAEFVRLVEAFKPDRTDPRFEVPTASLTPTVIQGGVKSNVVPDRVVVTVDRRMVPGESSATAEQELRTLLARLDRPGVRAEVEVHPSYEPYIVDEDAPVVAILREACARVLGRTPRLSGKAGATDASHLFHLGGIQPVIFGPGDPTLAHTSHEAVEVRQIASAAWVYVDAVLNMTAGD
jgi:succinyl-diaminopimelate desuccinylase